MLLQGLAQGLLAQHQDPILLQGLLLGGLLLRGLLLWGLLLRGLLLWGLLQGTPRPQPLFAQA